MLRFRLADGRTVVAEKDCTCLDTIHNGPHWLYTNDLWSERNHKLLATGNARGFISEDEARVKEKRWEMERRRIVEILR
jgi:hypothetical protein